MITIAAQTQKKDRQADCFHVCAASCFCENVRLPLTALLLRHIQALPNLHFLVALLCLGKRELLAVAKYSGEPSCVLLWRRAYKGKVPMPQLEHQGQPLRCMKPESVGKCCGQQIINPNIQQTSDQHVSTETKDFSCWCRTRRVLHSIAHLVESGKELLASSLHICMLNLNHIWTFKTARFHTTQMWSVVTPKVLALKEETQVDNGYA